jgi:hypothetical protein
VTTQENNCDNLIKMSEPQEKKSFFNFPKIEKLLYPLPKETAKMMKWYR